MMTTSHSDKTGGKPIKPKGIPLVKRIPMLCNQCGQKFVPKRHWQIFCHRRCKQAAYEERNPRQKIGRRTSIVIGGWEYPLGKPRWVGFWKKRKLLKEAEERQHEIEG